MMNNYLSPVQARFVTPGDEEWPAQLGGLADLQPDGLWVLGDARLDEVSRDSLGIIGGRASSDYGNTVAAGLTAELAAAGFTVVNGGGYGIDTATLRAVADARGDHHRGRGIVVQAGGIDCLYPAANADLFAAVVRNGGLIVTEQPLGTTPSRASFLARSRLIAGLAMGSVLVEAGTRSTVNEISLWSARLGRPAMAVPGPVTSTLSIAPHNLIRRGEASLVTSSSDILEHVMPASTSPHSERPGTATSPATRPGQYEAPVETSAARRHRRATPSMVSHPSTEQCLLL